MKDIPEGDWKYLRTIKDEMLETLCKRLNKEASQIISSRSLSQHEKFLTLFMHVVDGNETLGDCFDDWRRSKIIENLFALQQEQLLTEEHLSKLSKETRDRISAF